MSALQGARIGTALLAIALAVALSPDQGRAEDAAGICPGESVSETDAAADAGASNPDSDTLANLPGMALSDAVCVLGSPVRWTGEQWAIAGGAAAGLVLVSAFADVAVRDHTQSHKSGALDDLTRVIEPFGQEYAWGVLGAYAVVGLVFHDADARDTAIDGILASILASGIVTPSFKLIVGRARPNQSDDPTTFHPFQSGYASFPSGHATQAFVVASVISAHSDKFWVSASAYGLASLVAFARVYHNAHWTSDVVAGALVGTLVGRSVVTLNNRIRAGNHSVRVAVAPILSKDQRGAGVTVVF
jgi:membrane-associated phospholipid phosphatase